MRFGNTVAVIGLLPVNVLAVGYGWLAVGMRSWGASFDEPSVYEPPLAELGAVAAVVAAVGIVLWCSRLRGAAVFQLVPLLLLCALMVPPD
jgi:hypothetical protein